jgi:hypothetical protein
MKLASMRRLLTNRYCGDWNVLSVTNSTAGSSKKAKTDGPKMQGKKKADNVGEAAVPQASEEQVLSRQRFVCSGSHDCILSQHFDRGERRGTRFGKPWEQKKSRCDNLPGYQ